ncbi:hypothetical protein PoB_002578500 [Plakobranchus ocellatus]|uniref:Uncharacterized protein n=1 Tax=Plakobranchus ocellatus TaxID=259542 RepID=A0AAV3ZXB5_9GAST|nr:hypothetical protein PoB_002578500 [Plakobranchus ocellatus]
MTNPWCNDPFMISFYSEKKKRLFQLASSRSLLEMHSGVPILSIIILETSYGTRASPQAPVRLCSWDLPSMKSKETKISRGESDLPSEEKQDLSAQRRREPPTGR